MGAYIESEIFPCIMCTPDNGALHVDTKNGSTRSSFQINVVLREVWHSTQSTIMSDPHQDSSLPCRDKLVYWHPQWTQISGPEWSPPKLRVFDAEILCLRTNGGLPLGCWPCMVCVREIMMIRRDYSGRVVCWRLCPLSKDQVWGRCHQASARPRSALRVGGRLADGIPKCQVLHVTNKRNIIKASCNIHGHILEETDTAKYLGVNIHHKLSWNHHIYTSQGYIQGKFNSCFPSEKHPSMSSWNQGAVL